MPLIIAIVFVIGVIAVAAAVFVSPVSTARKISIAGATIIFAIVGYASAPLSQVSPFTLNTSINYGEVSHTLIVSAILGAIIGAFVSPFLRGGEKRYSIREMLQSLLATPITIIPVLQSLEQTPDPTWFSIVLTFAISYQSAVFWHKALEK
jgi:hypothetical protein